MNFFSRLFCLLLTLFFWQNSQAQLAVTQTQFQDATYNVYPVRLSSNLRMRHKKKYIKRGYEVGDVDYSSTPEGEQYLPFIPFDLKDGQYLAYYPKKVHKRDEHGNAIYKHEDTVRVAVTFVIKDNRRNGNFTWYSPLDGTIIQTGSFLNDSKSGNWKISNGKYSCTYSYKNGLLDGLLQKYHNGDLISSQSYKEGLLDGLTRNFFDKGGLSSETVYDRGRMVYKKKFTNKGQLTSYSNPNSKDTISKHFYSKSGKLSAVDIVSSDTGKIIKLYYYQNGNLSSESLVYRSYFHLRLDSLDYQFYRLLRINSKFFNDEYTIKEKCYHPNGQVEYEYDLNSFNPNSIIVEYDEKGIPVREVSIFSMPNDTTSLWLRDFRNAAYFKNSSRRNKRTQSLEVISNYSATGSYKKVYKNGKIDMWRNEDYLNYFYYDSSGVAYAKTSDFKRTTRESYNVLHTDIMVEKVAKKGKLYSDFSAFSYGSKADKEVLILSKIWSKDRALRIDYQSVLKERKSNAFLRGNDELKTHAIMAARDTVNFIIYYNNEPFTGRLKLVNKRKSSRAYLYKAKYTKASSDGLKEARLKLIHYGYDKHPEGIASYYDGKMYSLKNEYMKKSVRYSNQMLQGEYVSKSETSSYNYVDGQKHGLRRSRSGMYEYYFDKLHGDYVLYDCYTESSLLEYQMSAKMEFTMDTMNGWCTKYAGPHLLSERIYIDKGLPHGDYWSGNVIAPTSVTAKLDHGFLYDTASYYFKEGILKATCFHQLKDSVFYAGDLVRDYGFRQYVDMRYASKKYYKNYKKTSNLLIGDPDKYPSSFDYSTKNLIVFDANRTGDYVYYYKNGVMSQKGRVEDGFRVGTWDFWDLNGGRMKQIIYEKGVYINPQNGDSIKYYGKIEMWYPNGKPLLTGLVISDFKQFMCDQEMEVNFENVFYLNQLDQSGAQILSNNTGRVFEFHNNGEMRLEGAIVNGKRTGVWKFYDPDGRLEEVGSYEEGEKDGVWVKGDLEAVPHFYDRCMVGEVAPYTLPDLSVQGEVTTPVKITETMYQVGEKITSEYTELTPLYGDFPGFESLRSRGWNYTDELSDPYFLDF